jgi:hypothetical protein
MMNLRILLLSAVALTLLPGSMARAANIFSVSILFNSPVQFAAPGDTITFTGTVTSLEPSRIVDLNGCIVDPHLADFTTDNCAAFVAGAPFTLAPLEVSTPAFDMFTITVNLPFTGTYGPQIPGTFTVLGGVEPVGGGYDGGTGNILGQADFQVVVTPEPGTIGMLGLGLAIAALKRARG